MGLCILVVQLYKGHQRRVFKSRLSIAGMMNNATTKHLFLKSIMLKCYYFLTGRDVLDSENKSMLAAALALEERGHCSVSVTVSVNMII